MKKKYLFLFFIFAFINLNANTIKAKKNEDSLKIQEVTINGIKYNLIYKKNSLPLFYPKENIDFKKDTALLKKIKLKLNSKNSKRIRTEVFVVPVEEKRAFFLDILAKIFFPKNYIFLQGVIYHFIDNKLQNGKSITKYEKIFKISVFALDTFFTVIQNRLLNKRLSVEEKNKSIDKIKKNVFDFLILFADKNNKNDFIVRNTHCFFNYMADNSKRINNSLNALYKEEQRKKKRKSPLPKNTVLMICKTDDYLLEDPNLVRKIKKNLNVNYSKFDFSKYKEINSSNLEKR